MDIKKSKIAVVHGFLLFLGGGERLIMDLVKDLKAKFFTGFMSSEYKKHVEGTPYNVDNYDINVLHQESKIPVWRHIKRQIFLFTSTGFLKEYDLVIYSGNSVFSVFRTGKKTKNVLYCHTPVRLAYDLYDHYMKRQSWFRKPLFFVFARFVRFIYKRSINKMDVVVANSENIQKRIKRYLNKDSVVVYPPNDLCRFRWETPEDYYLSWARVDEFKRVEVAVKAFQKMPNKKLIVCSSGSKSDEVKELAKGYDNIEIRGRVTDLELEDLIAKCTASIYIPIDEDFGMTPVESLAAGKPCIVVDDGQLPITVTHEKTGYVCPRDVTPDDVVEAVKYLNLERSIEMKEQCITDSKKYSTENFLKGMREVIKDL